jgi:hypothetical protein
MHGRPRWTALYEIASSQEGLFTAEQAASVGLTGPHLRFHVARGNARRLRRGVYRVWCQKTIGNNRGNKGRDPWILAHRARR